jgi:hypothetical protein
MPPKGWRKPTPESDASPNDSPKATLTGWYARTVPPEPDVDWRVWAYNAMVHLIAPDADTASFIARLREQLGEPVIPPVMLAALRTHPSAADAALLKAVRKVARWNPDVAKPEHRGPFTSDIMALKAALAEHDAARSQP